MVLRYVLAMAKKKQKYGCVYTERKPSRAETFVTGTIIAAATVYLTFFFFEKASKRKQLSLYNVEGGGKK